MEITSVQNAPVQARVPVNGPAQNITGGPNGVYTPFDWSTQLGGPSNSSRDESGRGLQNEVAENFEPGPQSQNKTRAPPKRVQQVQRRNKAAFSEDKLLEKLPENVGELRLAFEGLQARQLGERGYEGSKYLSRADIKEYVGINKREIECKDTSKKFQASHQFHVNKGGPRGYELVRLKAPPGQKKARKDDLTEESGWVVPTEDWFDVVWEAHSELHGERSCGRDATMRRIREKGYYASIPKSLIQDFIDRCPDHKCRQSSRLAKAQQEQATTADPGHPTGATPNRGVAKERRQRKQNVRSKRSADGVDPSTQTAAESDGVPLGGVSAPNPPQAFLQQQPEISGGAHPQPNMNEGDPNDFLGLDFTPLDTSDLAWLHAAYGDQQNDSQPDYSVPSQPGDQNIDPQLRYFSNRY